MHLHRHALGLGLLAVTVAFASGARFAAQDSRHSRLASATRSRATIPYEFVCTGHRNAAGITCARVADPRPTLVTRYPRTAAPPSKTGGVPDEPVVGGTDGEYITMAFTGYAWNSVTNIVSLDATVRNNLRQPLGTSDGKTRTGVMILFRDGPTCTGGPCHVVNADGTARFTAKSQPYFLYNPILQPRQVSSSRNWRIYVAPAVDSFSFQIEAHASFPAEASTPSSAPLSVPDSIFAISHRVTHDPTFAMSYLDQTIDVAFTSGASVDERALAVAKIGGTVVGGWGLVNFDGDYAVGVPNSSGGRASLDTLLTILDSLPQVEYDGPVVFTDARNAEFRLLPKDSAPASTSH